MTIGDGHDLKSPRFAGDEVLEACYDDERFLRRGDAGSAVVKIQKALMAAGFPLPRCGADGFFGEETESAVRNYQRARGLNADGVIGPITIGILDIEFITEITESHAPPAPEPQVSKVPTPLVPESPVKPPRMSPTSPPRAPEVPPVEAPRAPSVERPAVKIPQPPVPPVAEPPILTTQTVPPDQAPRRMSRPITPPITPPPLLTDSQGRKFHSAGTWRGNSSFEVEAGKSIHFEISNPNVDESNIRIKTNTGEVKESVLHPQTTVDLEFSMIGEEPFIWRFYVETDREESLIDWKLYSNWVPSGPK